MDDSLITNSIFLLAQHWNIESNGRLINNLRNWDYDKHNVTYDNTTGFIEIHISKVYQAKDVDTNVKGKVIASQNLALSLENGTNWRRIILHENNIFLIVNAQNHITVQSLQEGKV